jgi:hypothetical protein
MYIRRRPQVSVYLVLCFPDFRPTVLPPRFSRALGNSPHDMIDKASRPEWQEAALSCLCQGSDR